MKVSGPHPLHLIFALAPFFARVKRGKLRSSLFAPRKRLLRRLQSSMCLLTLLTLSAFVIFSSYLSYHVVHYAFMVTHSTFMDHLRSLKDVRGNLISEYFCCMFGDPHFFFGRSLPFLILSIILRNKNICTWEVLTISHILFK